MLGLLRTAIEGWWFHRRWRTRNRHNETTPLNRFPMNSVKIGHHTYGELWIVNYSSSAKLVVGNYCSIGPQVCFLVGGEHRTDTITTFPIGIKSFHLGNEGGSKGDIVVGDGVWIGANVTICTGVRIGDGAVIAAGAVVTKDVGPYEIVGGVPARLIRLRLPQDVVDRLCTVDISKLLEGSSRKDVDTLYTSLTSENVEGVLRALGHE